MNKKIIILSDQKITSIQKYLKHCKVTELEMVSNKLNTDIVELNQIHDIYLDFSRTNLCSYCFNHATVIEEYHNKDRMKILLSLSKCIVLEINTKEKECLLEELYSNSFSLYQAMEDIWNANSALDSVDFTDDYFLDKDLIDNAFNHFDEAITCLKSLQVSFYRRFKEAFYLNLSDGSEEGF